MLRFLCAMGIFGTIGLFVRWVDLPSSAIVLWRGVFGSIALYASCASRAATQRRGDPQKRTAAFSSTGVFLSANLDFPF